MKLEISIGKFNFFISLFVFCLLPFHVFLTYVLAFKYGFNIDDPRFILVKMWKEIAIITPLTFFIIYKAIVSENKVIELNKIDITVILFTIMGILYTLVGSNLNIAIWSFRSLYYMFLFYAFGRIQEFQIRHFHLFLIVIYFLAVICSIFGVIQVEVFGPEFHRIFYGEQELSYVFTAIDYEKLRASSTFISTHEFGLFLVLSIFSLPFMYNIISKMKKIYFYLWCSGIIIIITGLAYSVSRSSFLILAIGIAFFSIRKIQFFIIAILGSLIFYLLLSFLGVFANFESLSSGSDPSAHSHRWVIEEALKRTASNPIGTGLGEVGVIVRRFKPEALQYEGEWWNILVQMGVAGGALYLYLSYSIFKISNKIYNFRNIDSDIKYLALFIVLTVMSLAFRDMILPRDQMNYSLGWFVIGAYLTWLNSNKSLNEKVI